MKRRKKGTGNIRKVGGEYFEYELPLGSSSMTNWRKRLRKSGAEKNSFEAK